MEPRPGQDEEPPQDDRLVLKWLESRPVDDQKKQTEERLKDYVEKASQPRHASGNACIKLCHFIEQCKNSPSPSIRDVVYSQDACLGLFNFFIEWNEKNQNRSMRQVLELVCSLMSKNPDKESVATIRSLILQRTLSIINHEGSQPLVKPSFKALECFLNKGAISADNLLEAYQSQITGGNLSDSAWDVFFTAMFDWMILADVSPAAGKFLVTLFRDLRGKKTDSEGQAVTSTSWQRWIRVGLTKYPQALENVKNYLLQPLFRLDRTGSLAFLEDLNKQSPIWDAQNQETDFHSLLQLAAIETGKKVGLIEEPNPLKLQNLPKKSAVSIILEEEKIGGLLSHASDAVRSMAFSLLVSSSSTIRPLTPSVMNVLRLNMSILYSDTDAKFRNETLSSSKHMIERLRGATALLVREVDNLSFQPISQPDMKVATKRPGKTATLLEDTEQLLASHKSFIEWYVEFLLGELIPTASYQRHITALKALEILLRSGLLKVDSKGSSLPLPSNATIWPFALDFFTPGPMRLLIDLLTDAFEDVRNSTASILKLAAPEHFALSKHSLSTLHLESSPKLEFLQETVPKVTSDPNHVQIPEPELKDTQDQQGSPSLPLLNNFLEQASSALTRTGRADYADGVAHCYELFYVLKNSIEEREKLLDQLADDLESKIAIAERNIGEAVLRAPIHGTFAALSLVWSAVDLVKLQGDNETAAQIRWNHFQHRIADSCSRIWNVVKGILCNDSPEGYFPEDIEDGDVLDTKDVLSYSFRAIHESSNLLRIVIGKTNLSWEGGAPILPTEVFSQIGDLTFTQLSTLRHRGAFSTVSLTFAKCCILTQYHDTVSSPGEGLLRKWYQGALRCIFTQVSTTRRSAGIPVLMTGIMAANSNDPTFDESMSELLRIASQHVEWTMEDAVALPQVHALNSLREVIKSATTAKRAEKHLSACMDVAATSLSNKIWAIRNCGLLLFRSIIDYLLGTNTNKATIEDGWDGKSLKIAYGSYPTLPKLLTNILERGLEAGEGEQSGLVESVFPVLDLIRRAGPPPEESNNMKAVVLQHLGSRVWGIRDMAAQTISALILKDDWATELKVLLLGDEQGDYQDANHRHGCLLAVNYFLERGLKHEPSAILDCIEDLAPILSTQRQNDSQESPLVRAAYTNIISTIALTLLSPHAKHMSEPARKLTNRVFAEHGFEDFVASTASPAFSSAPEAALWRRAAVRLAILTAALRNDIEELGKILRLATDHSADLTISAIECIDQSWMLINPELLLPYLVETCLLATKSQMYKVQLHLYRNISSVFERLSHQNSQSLLTSLSTVTPLLGSPPHPGEPPALQAERLRMLTWKILHDFQSGGPESIETRLHYWSILLSTSSCSDREYHDRYAVATSLHSFYANSFFRGIPKVESLIPSLLVLYDIMNDDDGEIREIGAATVSFLLKKSCVSLKAQEYLVEWLIENFRHSPLLKWNIVCRATATSTVHHPELGVTGKLALGRNSVDLSPRFECFSPASGAGDELFAVESQNLYEDEVHEIGAWTSVIRKLPAPDISAEGSSVALDAFAAWVAASLAALVDYLRRPSKNKSLYTAAEYTAYSQVLASTNALLQYDHLHRQAPHGNETNTIVDPPQTAYQSAIQKAVGILQKILVDDCTPALRPLLWKELLEPRKLARNNLAEILPSLNLNIIRD